MGATMRGPRKHETEWGFTLIELLVAIVVVGILTSVAILGVGGVIDKGETAACSASRDAAKAAATTHRANTGSYPTTFADMTGTTPKELEVPSGVTQGATTLSRGTSWTLTMSGGGATQPTFVCS
jgi:prepilin-type N-terminal cleavage/methylation domain-containing protein